MSLSSSNARPEAFLTQVTLARTRIYRICPPTPLERHAMPGGWEMLLKREDLSPIHSYKWRGAFNFMAAHEDEAKRAGLAAASAGNHAQGVALSAARLGVRAHLFMPKSAPRLKVAAVAAVGGPWVDITLTGDNFDQAAQAAHDFCQSSGALYVPPYDDYLVMAGQGTIGDEIVMAGSPPDVVFLQIGGGGLAAGVGQVLKAYLPGVRIIGVEEEGQASMKAAFANGAPVELDYVDVFCDGTAVKKAGQLTYPILKEVLDDLVTVSANEAAAAIMELWRVARIIPEPSGALGLAAALKQAKQLAGLKVGLILSGANLDFEQLAQISRRAGIGLSRKQFYQIKIADRPGSLLELLESLNSEDLNIVYLMYGQTDLFAAYPVLGFEGEPQALAALEQKLAQSEREFMNVSERPDVFFRVIAYQSHLFQLPFAAIINFPERSGALFEFMQNIACYTNISYFNYVYSGEQVGRALMVFSFASEQNRQAFFRFMHSEGPHFEALSPEAAINLGLELEKQAAGS